MSSRKCHSPGHPYWLAPKNSKSGKAKKIVTKTTNVWLLDINNEFLVNQQQGEDEGDTDGKLGDGFAEIMFQEEMVLMKGYVSLDTDMEEFQIKFKLCELFRKKIPTIEPSSFIYM